jgi:hypothetical protein
VVPKEYWPRLGKFESLLDRIYNFHNLGKHKTRDCDRIQGFIDEVLKTTKRPIKRKSPRNPRTTSSRLTRRSTTFMVAPSCMSPG